MNAKQMQIEFERRLQIISPDLIAENKPTSDTIFSFLNDAQDRIVKMCFEADDQLEIGTKSFKKNTDAIKSLLTEQTIAQGGTTQSGLPRFRLPATANDEYFLYVHSVSNVTGTYNQYTNQVKLDNILVKYEDLPKFQTTAFNKPIVRNPAVALYSDYATKYIYLVVVVDSYTKLNNIVLTYYRKPLRFNTISGTNVVSTCELPEQFHSDVVNMAVDMFINETKYRLVAKSEND